MNGKKKIIIGISSGIAGYKITGLIRLLKENGREVRVIMTQNAVKMFGTKMFEEVTGHQVYCQIIKQGFDYRKAMKGQDINHIRLADEASLIVIAPATANLIGKIAHGIADDLLTSVILAATSPVLICPSMNVHMWENPVVQENIGKLGKLGYHIFGPGKGRLACGYNGIGRLPDMQAIFERISEIQKNGQKLKDKKIIVTAGATMEPIDGVRYITNKGSGKMGTAIAEECKRMGAEVLLIRSKTAVESRNGVKEMTFETVQELSDLIKRHIRDFGYIFHTASVGDFRPQKVMTGKIDSRNNIMLKLVSTAKILPQIKSWNPGIKVVGFKAVFRKKQKDLIEEGMTKLRESNADYIIANDVGKKGIGFRSEENEVYVISSKGLEGKITKADKRIIAKKIIKLTILGK